MQLSADDQSKQATELVKAIYIYRLKSASREEQEKVIQSRQVPLAHASVPPSRWQEIVDAFDKAPAGSVLKKFGQLIQEEINRINAEKGIPPKEDTE